jgi:hypothetical protein
MKTLPITILLLALSASGATAQSLQVSGGFDTRYKKGSNEPNTFELRGAFLNLRKVFSDELGDRLILVTQYDFEDNFRESHFYYTYAQIKGPLGKINFRIGRYVLPFGLLTYYDTERLLLQTLEKQSLGIKTDVGAQVFGYVGDLDYAFSISNGVGRYWKDIDRNKLLIARLGLAGEDTRAGLSCLNGQIFTPMTREFPFDSYAYRQRLAFDIEHYYDLFIIRSELLYGSEEGVKVGSGFVGVDYSITPTIDVNLMYAVWNKKTNMHLAGVGFSYNFLSGAYLRFADTFQIINKKVVNNEFQIQIYVEFRSSM